MLAGYDRGAGVTRNSQSALGQTHVFRIELSRPEVPAVPRRAHALGPASGERHDDEGARGREVADDAVGERQRLLRRVGDPLVAEAPTGQRREGPYVSGQAAFRMRSPL